MDQDRMNRHGKTWGAPNRPLNAAGAFVMTLALAVCIALSLPAVASAAAPANDNFASAEVLTGVSDSIWPGTNVDATKESGEPEHAGNSGGASVWYRWQAPETGAAEIDMCFGGTDFSTLLAVYTGSSVSGLSEVDSDAGCFVEFDATAGTIYQIVVDGAGGQSGLFEMQLRLRFDPSAPPNDDFKDHKEYSAGDSPVSVAVGDFDEDGRPDLAAANWNSENVSVLRGDGKGSFGAPRNFAIDTCSPGSDFPPYPNSVAIGDFNEDSNQDLAVGLYSGCGNSVENDEVSILLGDGTGSFGSPTVISIASHSFGTGQSFFSSIAVDDFDADGKDDIAASSGIRYQSGTEDGRAIVAQGNGDGTFNRRSTLVYPRPRSIAVGDLNRDSRPDLLLPSERWNVSFAYGNGEALFPTGVNALTANLGSASASGLVSAAIGDFDGDGTQDFVTSSTGSDNLVVGITAGAGAFYQSALNVGPTWPNSVAIVDFDLDGKRDLAVARAETNDVAVLRGSGNGLFGTPTRFPVGSLREWTFDGHSLAVGDFDCDGAQDLVTANGASNSVSVLMNAQGDGTVCGDDGGGGSTGKPKLANPKITPNSKKVKRGKKTTFRVKVKNIGDATAKNLKVCAKGPKKLVKVPKCRRPGNLAAGKSKTVKFKVKVKKGAKKGKKAKITFTAYATGARKKSGKATVKIR